MHSLSSIVFVYVPMMLFCAFAILLTYRQMKRRDAGALDAGQALEQLAVLLRGDICDCVAAPPLRRCDDHWVHAVNRLLATQLLTLSAGPVAASPNKDQTAIALQRCLAAPSAVSTAGQTECEATAARRYDTRMNSAYTALMRRLPAEAAARLRTAQRGWLAFRSADSAARSAQFETRRGTMTPMYDVLSVESAVDRNQLNARSFRLAMSAGKSRHYRVDEVLGRHFVQTARIAGLGPTLIRKVITGVREKAESAPDAARSMMPGDFADEIHDSIRNAIAARLDRLDTAFAELG